MANNIKERLKSVASAKGLSMRSFEDSCGLKRGNISNMNQDGSLGSDKLSKIIDTFHDIDPYWLITGKGEMLKTKGASSNDTCAKSPILSDKGTKKTGNTQENSEKKMQISYDPNIGTPYFDVDFIGGFNEIFNNQTAVPACNVLVPGFEKAQLWCNVTGHSMEPKINHGDIIALRECTINDIQYGELYAVVLDTIRTIKILRRGTTPDTLLYVPINKPDYEDQEFEVSRIIKVFEVLGSIARFF